MGSRGRPKRKHVEFNEPMPNTFGGYMLVVQSAHDGDYLGGISYYGRWRKHVLEPFVDTVWSEDCLDEVAVKLRELDQMRRQGVTREAGKE